MVGIILGLFLSFSFIFAQDISKDFEKEYIKPFLGVNYNVFSVDKIKFENKKLGLTVGWLVHEDNKIILSNFGGVQKETTTKKYTVNATNLAYEYSFNNQGENRGFTLSSGLQRLILLTDNDKADQNGTITTVRDTQSYTNLLLGVGYEYKINKNYIVNLKHDFKVIDLGNNPNKKTLYNTKLSLKYIY